MWLHTKVAVKNEWELFDIGGHRYWDKKWQQTAKGTYGLSAVFEKEMVKYYPMWKSKIACASKVVTTLSVNIR